MATPIKSTSNAGNAPAVNGVSPAVSDMLARLGTQGGNAQGQQLAFSQWMDKHAVVSAAPTEAKQPSETAKPTAAAGSQVNGNAAARASEQALARSRQQAMMANKQLEAKAAQGDQSGEQTAKLDARNANTQRKDGASKARSTDKAESADKTEKDDDKDAVPFNTAMGEGSAVVRELTPPPTIQANDAAGMMAWLASLTHGDLGQGKGGAAGGEQGEGAGGLANTSKLQGADGREQDAALIGDKSSQATHGALALDNPMWQSVSASANLQVDAMLAQAGKAEGRTEGDPLAGLMANGGIKGAAQNLGEATGVRHESSTLPTPVDSPDFAQALADKVKMWVGKTADDGTMTAELHLNPAEMGPINVKISLDGQTAQVDFAAAALETRKAIEASLATLSSALSDVGLNMTGGDVSSQTAQQQFSQAFAQSQGGQGGQSGRGNGASGSGDADNGPEPIGMRAVNAPRPGRLGGLDLYA